MRLSILDDYQGVALDMADWAPVRARGIEIAVERFPSPMPMMSCARSPTARLSRRCASAPRSPRSIVERLPKLKLLDHEPALRNASFDMRRCGDRRRVRCAHRRPGGGNEIRRARLGLILGAARRIAEDQPLCVIGGWQTRIGSRVAGKTLGLWG